MRLAAKIRPLTRSKGLSAGDGLVGIDRLLQNVRHGRFEQSLAGLTGIGALITGVEIWLEHDRASFANRMMWIPVALTPAMAAAGIAGIFSGGRPRRFCRWSRASCSSTACRASIFTCGESPSVRAGSAQFRPLQRRDGPADLRTPALRPRGRHGARCLGSPPRAISEWASHRARPKQRFPGYDVMRQQAAWDEVTTSVVTARLGPAGPSLFFTAEEEPAARALLDRLLAQDEDPRVPVFEVIDERLAERHGDGYRYEDLPDDPEAWRRSIAALDETARSDFGQPFAQLGAQRAARHHRSGAAVQRKMARPAGRPPLLTVDALRLQRLLRPSLGLERDRLRRSGLSARLQDLGSGRPRALGGRGARRRGPGPVGEAGRGGQEEACRAGCRRSMRLAKHWTGTNELVTDERCPATQRVGLAAAERRVADEPSAAPRHAPLWA